MSGAPDHRLGSALSRGIGLRLLVLIVLFSSVVTALLTVIQLYLDYRRDVHAIDSRLDQIEQASLPSLAGSLWHVNVGQIELLLEGLLRLPDMQYVEVREVRAAGIEPLAVAAGRRDGGPVIARDFPLVHDDRGTPRLIGHFHAEASLNAVYGRLIEKAVVILVGQGVKTFLVSLFTLYIVYWLVARHLADIAAYAQRFSLKDPAPPLVLRRHPPRQPDELDRVVEAFNAMRLDLQSAYEQLRAANAELASDIRRRDEQEQAVQILVERLTRTNGELERLAQVAAHDLQEPARAIASYAQLIEKRYGAALDAEGREFLGYMTGGAKHIKALLTDLERYTWISRRTGPLVPVDLGAVCARAAANLAGPVEAAGAIVEVGPLPVAMADPDLVLQVFENLIDNAVKFRRPDAPPRVQVRAEPDGDQGWVVVVADNGIGLGPTDQDVFEIFRRLHPATYAGTGMGLAICRHIIERSGGRIWIEQPASGGTEVRFSVAAALPAPVQGSLATVE